MKIPTIVHYLVCFAGSVACYFAGPWYSAAIFLVVWFSFVKVPMRFAVITGAVVLFSVHALITAWIWLNDATHLLGKAATVLGGFSPVALWIITAITGAISGALAGMLGTSIRSLFIQSSTS